MNNSLISYNFDDLPVRVVLIAGDPWFVANDLAKALGYRDAFNMARNLEDDEKGTHIMSTLRGEQELSIVSESGMYAAIFKSRREEAQRFRKWVTADVLPELRKTGRYVLHDQEPAPQISSDFDPPRLIASVSVVREARRLFGTRAARNIWAQLGLPISIVDSAPTAEGDPLADPLKEWLEGKSEITIAEACTGLNVVQCDHSVRYRIGALLRMFGWTNRPVRRGNGTVRLWSAPATAAWQSMRSVPTVSAEEA
jgi:hypothetical protein